jgi:hypothetical protein
MVEWVLADYRIGARDETPHDHPSFVYVLAKVFN